jgi:hypothetical protein
MRPNSIICLKVKGTSPLQLQRNLQTSPRRRKESTSTKRRNGRKSALCRRQVRNRKRDGVAQKRSRVSFEFHKDRGWSNGFVQPVRRHPRPVDNDVYRIDWRTQHASHVGTRGTLREIVPQTRVVASRPKPGWVSAIGVA